VSEPAQSYYNPQFLHNTTSYGMFQILRVDFFFICKLDKYKQQTIFYIIMDLNDIVIEETKEDVEEE
jgi:hypothetical protein